MIILLAILNKVFLFVFFMACLNIFRHIFNLAKTFFASTENESVKYLLSTSGLLILGTSVAFVLMSIFSGIVI